MGDHFYSIGTGVVILPIQISGSDLVTDVTINAEITNLGFAAGSGNFPSGPSPTISWQGAPNDVTDNFMSTTPHLAGDAGSDNFGVFVLESLDNPNGPPPIPANGNNGVLINLVIDFTGFNNSPGTWRIILGPTNGNDSTTFFNRGRVVPVAISDGTVSIVPEPSSLALVELGLMGLAAWGWRRRKARGASQPT